MVLGSAWCMSTPPKSSDEEFVLPVWSVEVRTRVWSMCFSLWSQIDGLLYAVWGVRLERDVLAGGSSSSVCEVYGLEGHMSCGSFVGLYATSGRDMPGVVAAVASYKGAGVFVVPVVPGAAPRIVSGGKSVPWYDFLLSHSKLVVGLPRGSVGGTGVAAVAVFAVFGRVHGLKGSPRSERRVDIEVIPDLVREGPKLGVRPRLLHRVSPLADSTGPTRGQDTAPGCDPFPGVELSERPSPLQSRWSVGEFKEWSEGYPHRDARDIGLEVMGAGVDTFVGDRSKAVGTDPILPTEGKERVLREKYVEMVEEGKMWGPSRVVPYPNARVTPGFDIPKDKDDPLCEKIRPIYHFSKENGGPSVNDLCGGPNWLQFHPRASHFRDTLCWGGQGVEMVAVDVPGAFTLNHVAASLLFLMVLCTQTPGFGREFWVVLCTPFGWRPAEWGWQAVLLLIMWRLIMLGWRDFFCYVDNFFFFFPDGTDLGREVRRLRSVFEAMRVPLHEWQVGKRVKALGWWWWSDVGVLVCEEKKLRRFLALVDEWKGKKLLPLSVVRRLAGKFQWLSVAHPQARSAAARWVHVRTIGDRRLRRSGGRPSSLRCKVSTGAMATLTTWSVLLTDWDGKRKLFLEFGPVAAAEVLGRVDAATTVGHGCGGLCLLREQGVLLGFSHVWSRQERERAFVLSRESSGVFEMLGAEWWFRKFESRVSGKRVLLEMDSEPAVMALDSWYSKKEEMMGCLDAVLRFTVLNEVVLRVRWISGVLNDIADCLSHGRLARARWLAMQEFGMELWLV